MLLENLTDFASTCTNVLQLGSNLSITENLLQRNHSLHVTNIIDGNYAIKYLEELQGSYGERYDFVVSSPYDMVGQLSTKLFKSFDGVLVCCGCSGDVGTVLAYVLSSLRFMKNDALVLFEQARYAASIRESLLFEPRDGRYGGYLKFHRPNIKICTLAVGENYKCTVKDCIQSKYDYVQKHGYELIDNEHCIDTSRPLPWSKVRLVQSVLESTDIVLWLDGDTMVTNHNYTLDELLIMFPRSKDMFIGKDLHNINSGVFMIRNTPKSKEFLEDVYAQTDCINNVWWEQASMIRLMVTYYNDIAHIVPQRHMRIFNGYPSCIDASYPHREQDFIIHFPSLKNEKLAKEIKDTSINVAPDYQSMWSNIIMSLYDPPYQMPIIPKYKHAIV